VNMFATDIKRSRSQVRKRIMKIPWDTKTGYARNVTKKPGSQQGPGLHAFVTIS
jgi:hypothetical protein